MATGRPTRTAPPGLGLGFPRLHLRRTDSTNDRARELALRGAPHGTLVTAAEQGAGRGRQGRHWSAPAGSSLLMSIVLRQQPCSVPGAIDPDRPAARSGELSAASDQLTAPSDEPTAPSDQPTAPSDQPTAPSDEPTAPFPRASLPLLAAVALCDAVGSDARIKWPNDVLLDKRKLAGILVEGRPQHGWAVLGVGVNVAVRTGDLPAPLRDTAATLGGDPEAIEPFLAALLAALETRLRQPTAEVLEAWRERDALRGREVAWSGGRGRAAGIDGEGRLVVDLADGSRTALAAGEVHLQSAL